VPSLIGACSSVELAVAPIATGKLAVIRGDHVRASRPNTGVVPDLDECKPWIGLLTMADRKHLIAEDCFALGSVSLLLTSSETWIPAILQQRFMEETNTVLRANFPNWRKLVARKSRRRREVELNALVRSNYPAFCDLYHSAIERGPDACRRNGMTVDVMVAHILDHEFPPRHRSGFAGLWQRAMQTTTKRAA
jgi:hypothetical protein